MTISHNRALAAPPAMAVAFAFAVSAIVVFELVQQVTDQLVWEILVLPVLFAVAHGGVLVGGATGMVLGVFATLRLPPGLGVTEPSAEAVRLALSMGVSVIATFVVVHLRTQERRFRAVVTVASEGIWTIGADGRTTYVNPRMAEMLGYTPEEMHGRRFSEFVAPAQLPLADRGFEDRKHGVPDRNEIELLRKDGAPIWAHYAGTPMMEGRQFTGALAVVTDLTERRRHEATIREQAETLARANRQKEEFLAVLAHELRNALSPLITAVRLLELKSDGSLQRERAVILRQFRPCGSISG